MQVESLRQRLTELKKASIQLKSKVLQDSRIDLLNVSDILMGVLPSSSNLQVSLPLSQMNTLLDIPLSRQANPLKSASNQSLSYSPNSSIFAAPPIPQRNQDLILWNSTNSSQQSSPSREAIEVEIEKLRAQNDQIQTKIFNLNTEIADERMVESLREEESWKEQLPFINKEGTLGILLTKLHIKDYDFDKIDFEKTKCQLVFDRLTIHINHRPQKVVKLSTISQVKYLGDRKMRLQFKEEEIIYLYIQYATIGQRQEWDLAFITNHKIAIDKEVSKSYFIEEKETKISKIKSKSSLKANQFEPIDIKSHDKDHKRKGSVRFNDRKFQKSNYQKQSHSSSLKRSQLSAQRSQFQYTLNGVSVQSPETPQGGLINTSGISQSSNKDKSLKDFMVFGQVGESHQQSRTNTSKFNVPENNFQNLELYPTFMQEPAANHQEETAKPANEWEKALFELKEGYFFTKYAKNGFKPHNKKIFVSSEEEMLICANSQNLNDRRVIKIESITALKYPAIGQGIRKYIKNAKVENFCVIQYQNQGKQQVIELGCNKVIFIQRFCQQFREFLRRKGGLIND